MHGTVIVLYYTCMQERDVEVPPLSKFDQNCEFIAFCWRNCYSWFVMRDEYQNQIA